MKNIVSIIIFFFVVSFVYSQNGSKEAVVKGSQKKTEARKRNKAKLEMTKVPQPAKKIITKNE